MDWLIPTIRAISFLGYFLWSKAKICDFCSEVSCLYIRNTKIINLRESSKGDSFFVLPVLLFGATRPGREANPRCFSWIRAYEKRMICCTSILKVRAVSPRARQPSFATCLSINAYTRARPVFFYFYLHLFTFLV